MTFEASVAIYILFWVMSAFVVLPFGVRTHDEAGAEKVPGQAESAPHEFRPKRIVVRTTLLASVTFGLYYANYVYGWVGVEAFNFFRPPALGR